MQRCERLFDSKTLGRDSPEGRSWPNRRQSLVHMGKVRHHGKRFGGLWFIHPTTLTLILVLKSFKDAPNPKQSSLKRHCPLRPDRTSTDESQDHD